MEFVKFPKIARYNREVVVTEKIDGTNAQVYITEDGEIYAGSRNRWLTIEKDNYGFARWVEDNRDELLKLGPGRHFGEWWGQGIQRKYNMERKVFSLFNVKRWIEDPLPDCCSVVPIVWNGNLEDFDLRVIMEYLRECGSLAAPGFMNPEGIVIYHVAGNVAFKHTFDDRHKEAGE